MKISHASINFNENGTPVASAFDDVYFSNESGIQETQYVFIDSNQLNERWSTCTQAHFNIGETGFGTGLNFLVAAQQFLAFKKHNPSSALQQLYFLSTEKYPLYKDDLRTALALWPELQSLSSVLIEQYPIPLPGLHRIHLFDNQVILDLWLGDATEGFAQCHSHIQGRIDAWFLDGFAPSKNNTMWQDALFTQLKRLSRADTTFATFTAAGAVKRGLRDAGFSVRKQNGFGKKREMLVGNVSPEYVDNTPCKQAPIFHRHLPVSSHSAPLHLAHEKQHIAIVGGGIAGAICAYKLIKAGKKVSLYCADNQLAQGASGNEQAGFYPQLNAEAGIASQIHAHSFLYARRFYDQLLSEGHTFRHAWCGVLQLCFNANVTTRYENMMRNQTWPQSLVNWLEPEQATAIANVDIPCPSLYLPLGGWLSAPDLVNACIQAAGEGDFMLCLNHRLIDIQSQKQDSQTQLLFSYKETNEGANAGTNEGANAGAIKDKTTNIDAEEVAKQARNKTTKTQSDVQVQADMVILACGAQSSLLEGLDLPFRMTRGQVERIPSNESVAPLNAVLCHKGYLTPASEQHHAMGSTYVKNDMETNYRENEAALNLSLHQQALHQAAWSHDLALNTSATSESDLRGRAAIRCSLPDHLPVVGALPDIEKQKDDLHELYKAKNDDYYPIPTVRPNVYVLTGLGSRGLTTAPLMAEILVSQICSAALPMENNLLNALNPNRFLIRDLIRRR